MKSHVFRVVTAFLVASVAIPAAAKRTRLAEGLRGLRWGATVEDVKKNLRRHLQKKYKQRLEEADSALDKRVLQKQLERDYEKLIGAYTRFDGQRTGMEIGIASDEFRHGSGESALLAREPQVDRYYFFIGGKLWKIFTVYSAAALEGIDFKAFVAKLRKRLGRPTRVQKVKRGSDRAVVAAIWRDRKNVVEARDRSEFFQSFTLSYTDRRVLETIEELRGKPVAKSADPADSLVDMATGGKPTAEPKAPEKKAKETAPIEIY